MNLFARQVRTLMTAATAAAVVAAGGMGAGCAKKSGQETVPEIIDTLSIHITYDTLTDSRDGKTYKTVKIGEQIWMAENLNYQTDSGAWCYENSADSCNKYGRLYDWNTAKTVCPAGYHLPSREEWQSLVDYAGGDEDAGEKLKARSGWKVYEGSSGNGTDDFGWSALPGGGWYSDGGFNYAGKFSDWWTATEGGSDSAYVRGMGCNYDYVEEDIDSKSYWIPVRCIADPK